MQVAVLLPKGSSVYVGLLNGCFDSSVVTQMAVKTLHDSGINRRFSYIGVAILCVVISGFYTLLHPGSKNKTLNSSDARSDEDKQKKMDDDVKLPKDSINITFNNDEKQFEVAPPKSVTDKEKDVSASSVSSDDVIYPPVGSIICSRIYFFHILWFTALLLRFFYFIGSVNRLMVKTLENDGQVSYFTDVMAYTMLGGMLSSFIAGQVFETQNRWFTGTMKTVIPLTVTSCLAILLSSLAFLSSTAVLYADFVVLTFFRSFVFSVNMDFIIISFPEKFMSVLFGLAFSISGVLTLTQYALFTWTEKYDGAMTHVNIALLCLSIISLLHPVLIFMSQKRRSIDRDTDNTIHCSVGSEDMKGLSTKL
ncbi:Solute carrier family 43 member 3 [Mizuhopecten yessoensis]|uniref:Solute carrier family 43 member 3 n=2 Tax=Mizuhopecten yessoensis TaxID=6573 RepID=A0A210QU27_MIZYE|nr:Solute carrier family 43 member 3 [Mizuhopecten yessoensis]